MAAKKPVFIGTRFVVPFAGSIPVRRRAIFVQEIIRLAMHFVPRRKFKHATAFARVPLSAASAFAAARSDKVASE